MQDAVIEPGARQGRSARRHQRQSAARRRAQRARRLRQQRRGVVHALSGNLQEGRASAPAERCHALFCHSSAQARVTQHPRYASFSACARSAIRSSGCSMPIDSRIVESSTPIRWRTSSGHAGMGHGCRVAGKRFGAAEADGQLEDLQRVQEAEGGRLAAVDVEGEGRAGAGALRARTGRAERRMRRRDRAGSGSSRPSDGRAGSRRRARALLLAFSMRIDSVSSERPSIQQECGSSCVPMAPRSALTCFITAFEPSAAPAIRSEWPPTYLVSE